MSDQPGYPQISPARSEDPPLQFETAQPVAAAPPPVMACASCRLPMTVEYYEIGGRVICPTCRNNAGAALAGGAGKERFILAMVYGGMAALVSTLIWWGVRTATGYEIGLIAVAVGLLVGYGVRLGSQGLGGRRYQVLAVVLTYFGITLNYVPDVMKGLGESQEKKAAEASKNETSAETGNRSASGEGKGAAAGTEAGKKSMPTVVALIVFVAVVVGIAAAAPFLAGTSNAIGLLIIAFALWEAWKVNRAAKLVINGPYRINAATPEAAPAGP